MSETSGILDGSGDWLSKQGGWEALCDRLKVPSEPSPWADARTRDEERLYREQRPPYRSPPGLDPRDEPETLEDAEGIIQTLRERLKVAEAERDGVLLKLDLSHSMYFELLDVHKHTKALNEATAKANDRLTKENTRLSKPPKKH